MDVHKQLLANQTQQELDNAIGTSTRVPRLMIGDSFAEWKYRFIQHIKGRDPKLWRSIMRGPVQITYEIDDQGTLASKPQNLWTDEDFEKTEIDEKAMALITQGLASGISVGFRDHNSAKELWEALIEAFEGNEDMKSSRKDMLRQKFNLFNYILHETLETQINRFVTLITQMKTADIVLDNSEMNKKLLNSLPRNWDMNIGLIKKTKDLGIMTLQELIACIKACERWMIISEQ